MLSVLRAVHTDRIRKRFFRIVSVPLSVLMVFSTVVSPSEGLGRTGYEAYEEAGSPPLGKLVYNRQTGQWGYWSTPGQGQGQASARPADGRMDRDADDVRQPRGSRSRGGLFDGWNWGWDDEEEPRREPVRRPRESGRYFPRTEAPERRPVETAPPSEPRRKPVKREEVDPKSQSEALCSTCRATTRDLDPRGNEEKIQATGSQVMKIMKAAGANAQSSSKSSPRTSEEDEEEAQEYQSLKDEETDPRFRRKNKGNSNFVRRLLKYAEIEADRRCRKTSSGVRCKRAGSTKGLGMCLQGVRMALQRTAGRPTNGGIGTTLAKRAGPHLRPFGYTRAPRGVTIANAPEGAVLVYDAPREPRKAGHIEIKGNGGFYSDYFSTSPLSSLMPGRRVLIGIYLPPNK